MFRLTKQLISRASHARCWKTAAVLNRLEDIFQKPPLTRGLKSLESYLEPNQTKPTNRQRQRYAKALKQSRKDKKKNKKKAKKMRGLLNKQKQEIRAEEYYQKTFVFDEFRLDP
jgi:hypothetical protein